MVLKNKNTLLINIYGAPGASKSTTAALVFGKLKQMGVDCELIREVAKDCIWEERHVEFINQLSIMGKQIKRVNSVVGKVDIAILDSPILLCGYYNNKYDPDTYNRLCKDTYNFYDNLDIYLERVKTYNPNGRLQSEKESDAMSGDILKFLHNLDVQPTILKGDDQCSDEIIKLATRRCPSLFVAQRQ